MNWLLKWFKTPRQKALECFARGKVALDVDADFDLAISWFNAAIRHDPACASGYFGRGFAHLKKAEYDRAVADLSEAIRLGPENPYSYYYRSLSYCGQGKSAQEQADYERARRLGGPVEASAGQSPLSPGSATLQGEELLLALRAALHETSLHDMDGTIRALAGQAMTHLDTQAPSQVPALLKVLRSEDPAARFGAAQTLGDLGENARPALDALTEALTDQNLGVRVQAARALWHVDRRAQQAIPVLTDAVKGDDEILCWIAADCLGEIGPEATLAIPVLHEALAREFKIAHVHTGIVLALERIRPDYSALGVKERG